MRISLCLMAAVLIAACGSGSGPVDPPGPTAQGLTADGWSAFESADYAGADSLFLEALRLNSEYGEAVTGRGWAALRSLNYGASRDFFDAALALQFGDADALAGLVLSAAALDDVQTQFDRGLQLLDHSPVYVFAHDTAVEDSDIRWFTAKAALALGNYAAVVDQFNSLRPGHGLHADQADFVERALELLEEIQGEV